MPKWLSIYRRRRISTNSGRNRLNDTGHLLCERRSHGWWLRSKLAISFIQLKLVLCLELSIINTIRKSYMHATLDREFKYNKLKQTYMYKKIIRAMNYVSREKKYCWVLVYGFQLVVICCTKRKFHKHKFLCGS